MAPRPLLGIGEFACASVSDAMWPSGSIKISPSRSATGSVHRVATDQRLAVGEIEFPIVPVSGQDEIRPERALARRITFVRAAIGNREHAPALGDEEHLLADLSHELAAAGVERCA